MLLVGCAGSQASAPAPGSPAASSSSTLYDRLGQTKGIETVIDDFLGRVIKDERINARFAYADVPRLRRRLIEFVCKAVGGPCTYTGRDMKSSHEGMGITGGEFDALAGHLVEALDDAHVSAEDKGTILKAIGPTKADIVEEP